MKRWSGQFLSLAAAVFLSQFILQWFQNGMNLELAYRFTFQWHTEKFLISWAVLMVPAVWLWTVIGNVWTAEIIFLFLSSVLGYVTYEKMQQRGEPFYPSDLKMAGQVRFLLEMISPAAAAVLLFLLLAAVFFGIYLWKKSKVRSASPSARPIRLGIFFLTSLLLFYVGRFQAEGNLVKQAYDRTAYWIPYSQQMNYYNNGFVAGFLYNLPSEPMEKPKDYREEKLRMILEKYEKRAAEINAERSREKLETNIIFIMNESFADPFDLAEMSKKWDPIPYSRQLMGENTSGKMLSQGYGGGTANMEFEALTGFSMEPFAPNINTPFTQFLAKEKSFPSAVSRLKAEGLHTAAIHPFDTTMYKRKDNYAALGFERFFYEGTMKHAEKKGSHPYISDQAAYEEVWERMKETKGPDFIHLVTMQNHTPYEGKYASIPNSEETGFREEAINQYLQDLRESDAAMQRFIDRLEDWEESAIVVFWGDHWPSVFGEASFQRNGPQVFYHTPVFVFNNREKMGRKELGETSPIYFFNEVLENLNAKVSPFEAFLLDLQKAVPAFEKGMYYAWESGKYVETRAGLSADAQELLEEYDFLMYDSTAGARTGLQEGFFEIQQHRE